MRPALEGAQTGPVDSLPQRQLAPSPRFINAFESRGTVLGTADQLKSGAVAKIPEKIGSSGWTRTSNPPVNSRYSPFNVVSYDVILGQQNQRVTAIQVGGEWYTVMPLYITYPHKIPHKLAPSGVVLTTAKIAALRRRLLRRFGDSHSPLSGVGLDRSSLSS